MSFHEGELFVQERAGVRKQASRIGASIHSTIPPLAREFLAAQPFVFAGSIDRKGRVWASLLAGEVGFLGVPDERTISIDAPSADDLLSANLKNDERIGLLAVEFETRRRMRANGRARIAGDSIIVETDEVFSNCPKYIQARFWEKDGPFRSVSSGSESRPEFNAAQREFIERADTFIIASAHETRGADVSHRGGNPGFVKASDKTRLLFPDYSGNMMFQTLGNLQANPRAGLLFYDFAGGRLLQLTGTATILWDDSRINEFPGADRLVEFELTEARESVFKTNLNWYFIEASPFNPKS
ncbi:MAG TPA: pyridoxamine 5'-phosphate oxidase family protein [Pyrinomonadaceae bacterium]|jgi:predicted pyridoxine 5'-phosphate oxidase superfamily flavin-nucleotide-binding protein